MLSACPGKYEWRYVRQRTLPCSLLTGTKRETRDVKWTEESSRTIWSFFLSENLVANRKMEKKTRYRSQTCSSHLLTRGVSTRTKLVNKSLARRWTTCGPEDYHINDSCCCFSSTAVPQIFSRPSRAIIRADETEFDLQIIFFLFSLFCCQIENKARLTHSVKSQSCAHSPVLTSVNKTFLQTDERSTKKKERDFCFKLFRWEWMQLLTRGGW